MFAKNERLTVIYDDHCRTCTLGKRFSESLDGSKRLDFVGMNTVPGQQLIDHNHLDMTTSAYAIRENGVVTNKAQMVKDVLAHNGLVGFLLSIPFRIPYVSDRLYDLIASHRQHGAKKD